MRAERQERERERERGDRSHLSFHFTRYFQTFPPFSSAPLAREAVSSVTSDGASHNSMPSILSIGHASASHVPALTALHSCMLTYARVCSRMLTYRASHVPAVTALHSRMLTYAHGCSRMLAYRASHVPVISGVL